MREFFEQAMRQLAAFYGLDDTERTCLETASDTITGRFCACCRGLSNKYYRHPELYSPLHVGQYTLFLYYAANTLFRTDPTDSEALCSKIYGLMKVVSGCDVFYQVSLPEVVMVEHPVGTVLGRAQYGNRLAVWQGVTVGGNLASGGRGAEYPVFGDDVLLFSHAKVVGSCHVGSRVVISANAYVKDMDIPDDSIVFGQGRNVVVKPLSETRQRELFEGVFSAWRSQPAEGKECT